jgi:hypothetical protein
MTAIKINDCTYSNCKLRWIFFVGYAYVICLRRKPALGFRSSQVKEECRYNYQRTENNNMNDYFTEQGTPLINGATTSAFESSQSNNPY